MDGYLFLSYSRRQFYFMEALLSRLENTNLELWVDIARLKPGLSWAEGIRQGLSNSSGLLLIASRDALASPYVVMRFVPNKTQGAYNDKARRWVSQVIMQDDKALQRIARYGDGYFGNLDVVEQYLDKLRAQGKDPAAARIRIQGLFVVVAQDPERALDELAPYFHHVNNTYGQWLNEDRASTGFGEGALLKPMTLEAFKASGILSVLTPAQAIEMLNRMRAKAPVEHFMMMLPPGLPPARFMHYAEVFAREVMPAFR